MEDPSPIRSTRQEPFREGGSSGSCVRPGRDDGHHRSDQGSRFQGRDQQVAHQEAAPEDPQGSEEGGLYWSLASQQDPVHRAQGRSEGLPPQDRDQQEDLQDRGGIQDEGRKVGEEQRQYRLRSLRQVDQPHGWLSSLRRSEAEFPDGEGLLYWSQEEGAHSQEVPADSHQEESPGE